MSNPAIYQLALVAGLIRAEELTARENLFYYNMLTDFADWIKRRCNYAGQVMNLAESNSDSNSSVTRKSLSDVLEHYQNNPQ